MNNQILFHTGTGVSRAIIGLIRLQEYLAQG